MLSKGLKTIALAGLMAGTGAGAASAFSTTEIQALYGDGFHFGKNGAGETARTTITLEHFTAFEYGDVFFFVDLNQDFDGPASGRDTDQYGEIYGHLSAKTVGLDFSDSGLIRDVGLDVGINQGTDFLVGLYGARVDFNVPGFNVLTFGLYAYDNLEDPFDRNLDTTYQATVVWNAPFEIGGQKFSTQGFIDFIGDQGSGVDDQIVFQPQLRWDIGHAMGGKENRLNLGLEYAYFENKFGVSGVDDNVLQVFLAWKLH
ncbi:hypothetical protein DDZ14_15255 [Maritimibacter sp. 55A14]|uniref:DUF5020 family protein n=1 Tax=Maritimibacter sp. 55A14 TaxID=2174844 RepID=UPI000D61FC75|nr:DUF5020 family protein [Maritimibacter sp. 55A14]PWE30514.1 hypothetical protein DDZ14_15255 [Maritimibacter sp. 55A14]